MDAVFTSAGSAVTDAYAAAPGAFTLTVPMAAALGGSCGTALKPLAPVMASPFLLRPVQ